MNIKKISITITTLILISCFSLTCCCYLQSKTGDEELEPIEEIEFSGTPNASLISNINISGQAIDVDVNGNYAYLTNDLGILYVIDIRDKENPLVAGKCTRLDSANIVIAEDNYAYISYFYYEKDESDENYTNCGFYIVDINKKDNPEVIYDYNEGEGNIKTVNYLSIEGEYAYISTSVMEKDAGINRFEIIDISNKKAPEAVGFYELDGIPSGIFIEDDIAYININYYDYQKKDYTGESDILLIDIKDKKNPKYLSSCRLSSNAWSVYKLEEYAYVSCWMWDEQNEEYNESMIQVIDIGDILKPEVIGSCKIPGGAWELDTAGGFIYTSSLSGGIYTVDVSEGNNPYITDYLKTFGTSCDITIKDNYGFIADGNEGLTIISLSDGSSSEKDFYTDGRYETNYPPEAIIEIFGDTLEENYLMGNPVYLSAKKTYDLNEDNLTYRWFIDDEELSSEESLSYYFDSPGEYEIKLAVDDGTEDSQASEKIMVADKKLPVEPESEHTFTLKIEYVLTNNGPGSLKDIDCFIRIPQTYYPYQVVNGYELNSESTKELFDNQWNKLVQFEFEEELPEGESLTASIETDITVSEFQYIGSNSTVNDYDKDDKDMEKYTVDDLFIDSDNPVIYDTAKALVRNESNPVEIARILYNFVVRNLDYDYNRASDRDYELLYASEILQRGSGVCADYAILYTALLRSASIPARLSSGVPVYVILNDMDKKIDIGHAWVEIKIPDYGWIPIDITVEDYFMADNYYLDIITERGPGYLYENTTMDWSSYYYDGFLFSWDGIDVPDTEQEYLFSVTGLGLEDIEFD